MEEFQRHRFTQVSAATVNREFVVYRAFFQRCIHWKYLKDHPMEHLKKLRESPIPRRKWTLEEIKKVTGPEWFMEVFNFITETGARPIEITSATWDKFDRSKRTLTVRSLKNRGTGERTLLLSDAAYAQLLRLYKPTGYIFTGEHGGKLSSQWLSEVCRRIVTRAGLSKELTLYGLRHAFARKLVKGGVNLKVVKDLMGHAKFETTEKSLEEDLEDQRKAVNLVSTANQLGM